MLSVAAALRARISTRAFLPKALSQETLAEILDAARWAPSGGNVQPWRLIAVAGEARDAVCALASQTLQANPGQNEEGDRPIYPENLWEPHRARRYAVGEAMYEKLGIAREDKFTRLAWLARNYAFFGAPAAVFAIIDRRMGHGQWAHLGMFLQSIVLAAQELGIASCMQESWARLRGTLAGHFALGESEMIYCAIALGYADPSAPVNALRSARAPLEEIVEFRGFPAKS